MPSDIAGLTMSRSRADAPTPMRSPAPARMHDTASWSPLRAAADTGEIDLWSYGRATYPGEQILPGVLPNLKSAGTWAITKDQTWGLDWHLNEGIEFTCVTAGSIPFSCEGKDFDVPAGYVTITRPWQLHRVGRPYVSSSRLTWFILDVGAHHPEQEWTWPEWLPMPAADIARLGDLLRGSDQSVWRASKDLLAAAEHLERALRGETTQPMARTATAIAEIFIELKDLLEEHNPASTYLSPTERAVRRFLEELRERTDESWTVDRMAAECGLGRTRFAHYCKQFVNRTPLDYLALLRIERAKTLLTDTDLRVSDIALLCGFQSSQYFATSFRRATGLQPLQLRRSA